MRGVDRFWEHRDGVRVGDFHVLVETWRGFQDCPWGCPDGDCVKLGFVDFTITNAETGESIKGPGLIAHLIREHQFFEGRGTPYRVSPKSWRGCSGLCRARWRSDEAT